MRSNTNNTSDGVTLRSSSLKRVRRGPGIAELERILREQEAIDITTTNRGNNQVFPVSSSCHRPRPPPRLGMNGGGGSGEHERFHMKLNEVGNGSQSDSKNSLSRNLSNEFNHGWYYKRNNGYPPQPMMNHFNGAYGTLASQGSFGLQNQLGPPSIQNLCYNNTSMSQDGHKMVGIKRSHASSLDNSLIPPSNFQVSSYNPSNKCYRDAKWGSSLELMSFLKVGPGHANSPPSFTSEVPPLPPPMFPCQVIEDKMENSFKRSESSGNDRQCFFNNFLEVKGQEGKTDAPSGSNHGGLEGGSGDLDLSLKL